MTYTTIDDDPGKAREHAGVPAAPPWPHAAPEVPPPAPSGGAPAGAGEAGGADARVSEVAPATALQLLPPTDGAFDAAPAHMPGLRIRGAIGVTALWVWVVALLGGTIQFLGDALRLAPSMAITLLLVHTAGTGTALWVGVRLAGLAPTSVLPLRRLAPRLVPGVLLAAVGAVILLVRVLPTLVRPDPSLVAIFEAMARTPWVFFLAVVLVGPVMEELLFRGVLLRSLQKRSGTVTAVLVSTLLFSLVHMNPPQSISAAFLGLGAAWLVLRTGSLLPAILLHVAWNATAAFGISALAPGASVSSADVHIAPALVAAGALALALGGALLWWQLREHTAGPEAQPVPAGQRRSAGLPVAAALVLPLAALIAALAVRSHARTGQQTSAVLAGCYELSAGKTPLALFGDSARAITVVRLTTLQLAGTRHGPARYLMRPAAATASPDTAYWFPARGDSLRLVDMRRDESGTILRLRLRNGAVDGSATRYAAGGQAAGAPGPVHGRKLACPRPPASPDAAASPRSPGQPTAPLHSR